jgi:endonuclease G
VSKIFTKNKFRITNSVFSVFLIAIALIFFSSFLITYLPSQLSDKNSIKGDVREQGIYHSNCLGQCPGGAANDNMVIDHEIILLSSNKITKFADWVAYKVIPANLNGPERKRNWAKDPQIDIQFTIIPKDYKEMSQDPFNFDRGHQTPLANFKNHEKWYVVNYLSNITPQKKDLNRGVWRSVEMIERKLAKSYGEVYVMTGPYYDKNAKIEGPSNKRVPYIIPTAIENYF